jgi:hypothetical protein
MPLELLEVPRRPGADQIVGRGDDAHGAFAELAQRKPGSTQRTHPDGEVRTLLQEIYHLIRQRDIERDLRMLRQEGWKQRKVVGGFQSQAATEKEPSMTTSTFWPNGARLAVSLSLMFEGGGQPISGAGGVIPDPIEKGVPDLPTNAFFAYVLR